MLGQHLQIHGGIHYRSSSRSPHPKPARYPAARNAASGAGRQQSRIQRPAGEGGVASGLFGWSLGQPRRKGAARLRRDSRYRSSADYAICPRRRYAPASSAGPSGAGFLYPRFSRQTSSLDIESVRGLNPWVSAQDIKFFLEALGISELLEPPAPG